MTKNKKPQVQLISREDLTKQLISNVSEQMKSSGIKLSPKTVMSVLQLAMEAVEGSPIKGADQKDLAIKVVMEIAQLSGLPEDQLTIITTLVDGGFVSDTIDLVIAATQGNLNVNQVTEVAQGCFKACFNRKKNNKNKKAIDTSSAVPVVHAQAPQTHQTPQTHQAQQPRQAPQQPTVSNQIRLPRKEEQLKEQSTTKSNSLEDTKEVNDVIDVPETSDTTSSSVILQT